ncbi:ferric reductase family protein [Colwellia sp. TT2012]|uniref:ferric reductase family protein n=1 Tax=Colwellia sp. TT2012 TaxID=1720342 RepID=UPI0009EADBE1|nr:ferric reductase family protein [Colwellia sp. TT2012]
MKSILTTIAQPSNLTKRVVFYYWLKKYSSTWLAMPWLLLVLTTLAVQFCLGFQYNSNDTTTIYLQVARACAYALLLILSLLWLPVMRHGLAALRRSRWTSWLPLTHAKNIHRWLGHVLLIASLIHGSCYLLYFNSLEAPFMATLLGEEADLVRSMKTTMYEFVSEDESIDDVIDWIALGMPESMYHDKIRPIMQEDCTKCHSTSSTMTYAIPSLSLSHYNDVMSLSESGIWSRQFRINFCGIVMLLLVIALWITSLDVVRKNYHHIFQHVHKFGYLMILLALLHIPRYNWLILPCIILVIEYIFSHYVRIYYDQDATLSKVNDSIMTLTLPRPAKFKIQSGHYLQLRIPGLKRFEWHDFSLTGQRSDEDVIRLKIKVQGDWTQKLYDRFRSIKVNQQALSYLEHNEEFQEESLEKDQTVLKVDIRGPFASPAAHMPKNDQWVMIAGGIGITPFLGFMHAFLSNKQQVKQFHLIWLLRDSSLLTWLKPFITSPILGGHIHIYLTKSGNSPLPDWLKLHSQSNLLIKQQRPDLSHVFHHLDEFYHSKQSIKNNNNKEYSLKLSKPHCFVCGPLGLTKTVTKLCQSMGWSVSVEQF